MIALTATSTRTLKPIRCTQDLGPTGCWSLLGGGLLIIKGEPPLWSRGQKEAAVAATSMPGERLTEVARDRRRSEQCVGLAQSAA